MGHELIGSIRMKLEPSIIFSLIRMPVFSRPHYNVNLQSISVGGQSLAIDPSVFSTSGNKGTIVDSGTTLAYLAEPAYGPFLSAVINKKLILFTNMDRQ